MTRFFSFPTLAAITAFVGLVSISAIPVKASVVTGTYNIDTTQGSATTIGGSFLDAYNLISTASSATYSLLTFTPNAGQNFTFSNLTNLTLGYNAVAGGIAGGSLRIKVDFTNNDSLLVLLGPAGTFVNPTLGPGSSGNLVTQDDIGRYDLSQGGLGGSSYTNYDAAVAAAGNLNVSSFTIIDDAGWAVSGGLQAFDLNGNPLTVNANLTAPEPATIAIMGVGLTFLGIIGRRRFARQ
jgi:PEP-CTERM motif